MKVAVTFDLNAHVRRAIANYYGDHGEVGASHGTCRNWIDTVVTAAIEDAVREYEQLKEAAEAAEAAEADEQSGD